MNETSDYVLKVMNKFSFFGNERELKVISNKPPCMVQIGVLICLPEVAKMVCWGSKHDAVYLLSVYTRLT